MDPLHENISIYLISSPEPSDDKREKDTDYPWIGDMTRSYIVEWEDDELDSDEPLEWDISLDRRDISSDCPPDKPRSTHDEADIDERIS